MTMTKEAKALAAYKAISETAYGSAREMAQTQMRAWEAYLAEMGPSYAEEYEKAELAYEAELAANAAAWEES